MATERLQQRQHDEDLRTIERTILSDSWGDRLAALDAIQGLLGDLPAESTVEHLVEILDRLAGDAKWEVRKAVVPVLAATGHPAARIALERLLTDRNQWVRQAAERAKRKFARITTPAEKRDRRARFAFDKIKDIIGKSPEKLYEAALLVGENHYEELAGDTAHELNTYLTTMDGLMRELDHRLLDGSGSSPAVREVLDKLRERSRYLKVLVKGLLDYARDAELDFEIQPLKPLIIEALDVAREKANGRLHGLSVRASVEIPEEVELEACGNRLLQAFVNILSNAFESLEGKEGPEIHVSAGAKENGDDRLFVQIRDTGCGMDPGQVENAKKRFRSLKKDQGGIGLGLPLALKIIEREHGGRLDIESVLGRGTTVMIELPRAREEGR